MSLKYKKGDNMGSLISLGLTFVVGTFILIGSLIIIFTKSNQKIINFSLALAFIVMIGLVFFELIFEAIEHLNNIFYVLIFVLIGIFILKILDHFIPYHENTKEKENLYHIGIVSSIALIIHNIIEGMAIYGVALTNIQTGILMALGVGLHNIPMGMVITGTIYNENKNKKKIFLLLTLLMLSTLIGGLFMAFLSHYINDFVLGMLLAITLGMLLYISIFELLPKVVNNIKNKTTILGMIMGIIVIIFTLLFHHH